MKPDIVRTGNTWSILLGTRSYEVTIVEEPPGELTVSVDGQVVPVAARRKGLRGPAAEGKQGPQSIVAPMPGRIVKVLVKAGDTVAARQGLVVVEAMKMENELRADRDGTVDEVHVRDAMPVEAGALLVVIR